VKSVSNQRVCPGLIAPLTRIRRLVMNVTFGICGVHGMRIHVPGGLRPSAELSWTKVTYGASPADLGAASTPSP